MCSDTNVCGNNRVPGSGKIGSARSASGAISSESRLISFTDASRGKDLAGVQDADGIEHRFDPSLKLEQRLRLLEGDELAFRQSYPVLAGDRASERDGRRHQFADHVVRAAL